MSIFSSRSQAGEEPGRRAIRLAALGLGALFLLILILGSYYTVDAGEKGVQTRFGSIVNVSDAGLHFKLPLIDGVTRVSVRTEWIDWRWVEGTKDDTRMEAYSHDQQPARISVKLAYHVKGDDASVRRLYAQYRNAQGVAAAVLIPRAAQAVKTTFGQYTAVSVVQNRARFNADAAAAVQAILDLGADGQPVPVVLDGLQIYDIKFSTAYEHAVEERMKAEVEVAKVTQNLERSRKEAEMQIVQAEAAAKAVRLRGEAEAAAIRARSDALRDSPKLVELTIAEKWNGQLPTTMVPGAGLPLLNLGRLEKGK